jgi:N-acetylneuraminic acid mutarotase
MQFKVIISMAILMVGCSGNEGKLHLEWGNASKLPEEFGKPNLGVAGPLVGVFGNRLLVAGGANFPEGMPWDGGKKVYQKSAYLYSFEGSELKFYKQFALEDASAYSANVNISDVLYSAGGENENGAIREVYRYQLNKDENLEKTQLPDLPYPLTNGGLVGGSDHLYFVGGENSDHVSDKVYQLHLKENGGGWQEYLTLPYPVSHAVVVSDGLNKIYVIGGRKRNTNSRSDIYDGILEIDINSKNIITIFKVPTAVASGTGLYYQCKILVFGGDQANTFHKVEDLLGQINLESNQVKKDSLIGVKNDIQLNHPGFSKENWAFDLVTGAWAALEGMPGLSPVTTSAVLKDNIFVIPSGEIRAGVRTDQILIGKIEGSK